MTPPARQKRDCQHPRRQHKHGTHRAYQADRCRCFLCRVAHAAACRAYRRGEGFREFQIDATGTRRRLQALAAVGVTGQRIAAQSGLSYDMVIYLRGHTRKLVTIAHAATIAAAYDALWDKGGTDADGRRCATQALAAGYALPLEWDEDTIDDPDARPAPRMARPAAGAVDDIAVERACRGDDIGRPLNAGEKLEAVRILSARKLSSEDIAALLGTTGRTVVRKRTIARLEDEAAAHTEDEDVAA